MKILFVYEHFFEPFDEGVKNFARMIHGSLANNHHVKIIRYIPGLPNAINSLLLLPRLYLARLLYRPDRLIFIPQASLTYSSLIKVFLLELVYGNKLITVGTQKRQLSDRQKNTVKRFKLQDMYVLSSAMAEPLKEMNIGSHIVNVGIDRDRYCPVSSSEKQALRKKYQLQTDKRIVLHVGHIKEKRNARWLMDVQNQCKDIQAILVGSTTTVQDNSLCDELEASGVIVLKEYLANIEEIYQLSDIYCFTVTRDDGAMETPLSVLEGMSTDLPIITTPFGRLPEQFSEDKAYQYVNNSAEIIALLNAGFALPEQVANGFSRAKTLDYTWQATAEKLLAQ